MTLFARRAGALGRYTAYAVRYSLESLERA